MDNLAGCAKNYFTNAQNIAPQLNVIPFSGKASDGFEATFYNPFIPIGLVSLGDSPSTPPSYPLSKIDFLANATQANYSEMLLDLFIAFMQSNKSDDSEAAVQYVGDYRNYFERFLNNALLPVNYNTFIAPSNMVRRFWNNTYLSASTPTANTIYDMCMKVFGVSNKRLWGAPGTYSIASEGSTNNPWNSCGYLTGIFTDVVLTSQLNFDPAFIPANAVRSYLAITDNGGVNPDYGSLVVPWSGPGPLNPNWAGFPGNPAGAIVDWITTVLTLVTGDAPSPYSTNPAVMTKYSLQSTADAIGAPCVAIPAGVQVTTLVNNTYTFGTLAIPASNHRLIVRFAGNPATSPYWSKLADFSTEGTLNMAVVEFINNL